MATAINQEQPHKKRHFWKKHWKLLLTSGLIVTSVSVGTPLLTGCSLNSSFSFGNFQSYLNPYISNVELPDTYGAMNYIYYGTNYQIPNHIYNNSVNLTIATDNEVCTLAHDGLIRPYKWSDFGLEDPGNATATTKNTDPDIGQLITNQNMLTTLPNIFTPLAWEAATAYTWLFKDCLHNPNFNLMQYAIPYFLQNIVFCYRGPAIPQLPPNSSYYQIFRYITEWNVKTQSYDPGHPDNRFIYPGQPHPELMMVKSPRTDFDIANIVRQQEVLVNQDGVKPMDLPHYAVNVNSAEANPEQHGTTQATDYNYTSVNSNGSVNEYWGMRGLLGMTPANTPSIQWYTNVLNTISKFFAPFPNAITFNTNSNPIIDSLALKEIMGGFIYNGDSVYTMQGGDYETYLQQRNEMPNPQNIHVVMPVNNLIAMDNIVINNSDSPAIYHKAVQIAYQLGLSGSMLDENTSYNVPICHEPHDAAGANVLHQKPTPASISQTFTASNGNSYYDYLSMSNFNWVDYTPELKVIYQYCQMPGTSGYFGNTSAGPDLTGQMITKSIRALDMHSDYQLSFDPSYYHLEMPFNKLADSNLGIAFMSFMNDV